MSETDAGKKAERLERPRRIGGGTAEGTGRARQTDTARAEQTGDGALVSMEAVVRRENVTAVYQRVVRNGGAPGVDGVTVDELKRIAKRTGTGSVRNCWTAATSPNRYGR